MLRWPLQPSPLPLPVAGGQFRIIFEPKCDAKGQFAAEQTDGDFTFCVDERGKELEGSRRRSDQFVGCDQKQSCPSTQCHLKCPFGFQFDSEGCPQCQCRDSPCNFVKCPKEMCQFGDKLTPCVHLLATTLREVDKLVEVPKSIGRPTVQCNGQGHFEKAQFDPINGQFWCVDPVSGVEAVGSRISASPLGHVSPPPDCSVRRHFCKSNCSALKGLCPHGLRMDHRGCPLDEQCQCRNACDDFKCSFPDKEICLLKVVECVDEAICPPIPTCVQNVCQRFGLQSIGNFVCSNSAECQKKDGNPDQEQSLSALSTDLSSSMSAGVDAFRGKTLSKVEGVNGSGGRRQGLCPAVDAGGVGEGGDCSDICSTDADCAGIQKCCPNTARGCRQCVQPLLTTSEHTFAAFQS
uniref:Disintegrin domain-containing protein n=1 Tax=Globodera pallida TaxID=36090 RepID=A0A183BY22_GLOPA